MSLYTDEELRVAVLPLAVQLVNTEVQRTMQNCNTKTIAVITKELINIVKTGEVEEAVTQAPAEVSPIKKVKKKEAGLKYS